MKRALGVHIAWVVAALVLGLGLVALGIFLVGEGLDRSDQWASVLGLFLNLLGVLTAAFSAWIAWRDRRPATETAPARQDATQANPSMANQGVHLVQQPHTPPHVAVPVHRRPMPMPMPMPTSVEVVVSLWVCLRWLAILLAGAGTLLGFEGIASAIAEKEPAVLANVIEFFYEAAGRQPPSEMEPGAAAAAGVGALVGAVVEIPTAQWYFRMVRGLREGSAETYNKVLTWTYLEAFFYIGFVVAGFTVEIPALTVFGIVLLIISPAVTISALNTRSARRWFHDSRDWFYN